MTMLKKQFLYSESEWIVKTVFNNYIDNKGFLLKGQNIRTGKKYSEYIVDDFGDYIQYILWFAQLEKDKKLIQWCYNHSKKIIKVFQPTKQFFKYKKRQLVVNLDKNIDTLTGLLESYNLSRDNIVLDSAIGLGKAICDSISKNNFISSFKIKKITLPLADAMTNGSYVEELVNLYSITKDRFFLMNAEKILQSWLKLQYFKKYSLFPDKIIDIGSNANSFAFFNRIVDYKTRIVWFILKTTLILTRNIIPKKIRELSELLHLNTKTPVLEHWRFMISTSMKKNSMLAFGMLALYKITKKDLYKQSFYKWVQGVKKHFLREDGSFYDCFDPIRKQSFETTLTKNNSLIEVFIDGYTLFKDPSLLEIAEKSCETWIQNKEQTGLFPERIHIKRRFSLDWRMMLDANTDFCMNLIKLYQLTEKNIYLSAAENCLKGIVKYNKSPKGYLLYVNYKNGSPIGLRSFFIKTKFNTLLLKLMLSLIEIQSGRKIFKDNKFWSLCRDR